MADEALEPLVEAPDTDEACTIDRLEELSAEDFERIYRGAGRPVIAQAGVAGLGLGSPAKVSRVLGSLQVTAGKSYRITARGTHSMRLDAFLDMNSEAGWKQGLDYVVDTNALSSLEHAEAVSELLRAPKFLGPEAFGVDAWHYLLVGHDGAAVSHHAHAEGYNLLVYGRKAWHIESPSGEYSLCEQRAGEVIYLPQGWYHEVRSIGETFGVAVQRRFMPFTWRHGLSAFGCLFLALRACLRRLCAKGAVKRS